MRKKKIEVGVDNSQLASDLMRNIITLLNLDEEKENNFRSSLKTLLSVSKMKGPKLEMSELFFQLPEINLLMEKYGDPSDDYDTYNKIEENFKNFFDQDNEPESSEEKQREFFFFIRNKNESIVREIAFAKSVNKLFHKP
jgi:hypothetical protein